MRPAAVSATRNVIVSMPDRLYGPLSWIQSPARQAAAMRAGARGAVGVGRGVRPRLGDDVLDLLVALADLVLAWSCVSDRAPPLSV